MGIGGRAQLPKVSYATAMDWFFILCLSFAFAVAVEYAIINFMDKMRADFRKVIEEHKKIKAEKMVSERHKWLLKMVV
jgi:gamma-aminobutyric acid receptor subunit alpha